MSDVILFNPVADPKRISFTIPPWALLYVAAPLVEEGLRVSIIDQNAELGWKKRLKDEIDENTLFVGTTAMTGVQIKYALEFTRAAKEIRDVPVVWGGGHASIFPEQTLSHPLIDFVVKGEGEDTARELARALRNKKGFKGIKGLWYKNGKRIHRNPDRGFVDLNHNSRIPYELIDVEKYIFSTGYAKRNFEICTSRGCPHRCGFCYNVCFNKQKWRAMKPNQIVRHLRYLVDTFKLDGINWREDNFFVDKSRVEAICKAMLDSGLKIKWHSDSRIDYFDKYDDAFISLLKKSGCSRITFGIESGSPRILDKIKKDITVKQVLAVNKKMKKHGIECMYHFSFGFMGETMEDVEQTIKLADRLLRENPHAGIWPPSIYTPYPGTPLFEESIERGFKVPDRLEEFINFEWTTSNLPWLTEYEARKLYAISYIMSAYASNIPVVNRWFAFRFHRLLKTMEPWPMPEKPLADLVLKGIRVAQLLQKRLWQAG